MPNIIPSIPGNFPDIIIDCLELYILNEARAFVRDDAPELAQKYEQKLTDELRSRHRGDKFLSLLVTRVDEVSDTATLLLRFTDVAIPLLPELKLGLARAEVTVERWVNLTTSSKPPIKVLRMPSYALEIDFENKQKNKNYSIRLGYAQDDSVSSGSRILLIGITWNEPAFYLFGLLGESDKGGILIDVECESSVALPLGPTGLGLNGIGLLYGEHFAPLLHPGANPDKVMEDMASAEASDYVDWATKAKDLETWIAVPDDLNLYGISASIVDMATGGNVVHLRHAGLAYLSYGPTIIVGGQLILLNVPMASRAVGAIDIRSKTLFGRATETMELIPGDPGAFRLRGLTELSASLTNQARTFVAIGGYAMDGCRIELLHFLELSGGARFVPAEGAAARAQARIAGEGDICGFGGGYNLWLDVQGGIGWNPVALESRLDIGGSVWIKVFGEKLGVGLAVLTELFLKQPLIFRLDVEFTLNMPWPLSDLHFPVRVFNLKDPIPANPAPTLKVGAELPFMHGPSGLVDKLAGADVKVWPDVMFMLDFQRQAGGSNNVVNPCSGYQREAGVDVIHLFTSLKVERRDPQTGAYVDVPHVRASWLLNASEGKAARSSRLAVPCYDPLNWLNRFDYAQPDTIEQVELLRFQTFGFGPSQLFIPPVGGTATATFEEITVAAHRPFSLTQVPWAEGYQRALRIVECEISFASFENGVKVALPVTDCELRVLGSARFAPGLGVQNGTAGHTFLVRLLGSEMAEWSIPITRTQAQSTLPLLVIGEPANYIAAVGFRATRTVNTPIPDESVLTPGIYRLTVQGTSAASFRGTSAPASAGWNLVRDFEVVPPPLRPYLRYSTLGDERIFGLDVGSWNPHPSGHGFGHYQDHFGQIRARVGYLSAIDPMLYVKTDDDAQAVPVDVRRCAQGTPACSSASGQWRVEAGLQIPVEEELTFAVAPVVGVHRVSVYRSWLGDGSDLPIDEWIYRVSRYASPVEHLSPGIGVLNRIFGPFGSRAVPVAPTPNLPANYDFDGTTAARTAAQWALPPLISKLRGAEDPRAGLSFLHALDWCGIMDADPDPFGEGPLLRPDIPDLCAIIDRASSPVALVLRTGEPCDWRRIEVTAVVGPFDAHARRFATKLVPSLDGCQCLIFFLAEDVPVRLPGGSIALRITFKLEMEGLPRLTISANPAMPNYLIITTFEQPFGSQWWEG